MASKETYWGNHFPAIPRTPLVSLFLGRTMIAGLNFGSQRFARTSRRCKFFAVLFLRSTASFAAYLYSCSKHLKNPGGSRHSYFLNNLRMETSVSDASAKSVDDKSRLHSSTSKKSEIKAHTCANAWFRQQSRGHLKN